MGLFSWLTGSKKKTVQKTKPKKAPSPHKLPEAASDWEMASVKFVHPKFGYAFLERGPGLQDVYVHKNALMASGLDSLVTGQKVEVRWGHGSKGPEAVGLRLP